MVECVNEKKSPIKMKFMIIDAKPQSHQLQTARDNTPGAAATSAAVPHFFKLRRFKVLPLASFARRLNSLVRRLLAELTNHLGIVSKIRLILQFHWLSITASLF